MMPRTGRKHRACLRYGTAKYRLMRVIHAVLVQRLPKSFHYGIHRAFENFVRRSLFEGTQSTVMDHNVTLT